VVALRLVEDLLVTAARLDATLDSCHFSPPQRYGSMRFRRPASSARTWFVCRRLRFRLVAFLVRMWLRLAWPALNLPEAVFRKRLAAPRCVLILGIAIPWGRFEYWPGRPPRCESSFHPAWPVCKPLIPEGNRAGPKCCVQRPGESGRPLCLLAGGPAIPGVRSPCPYGALSRHRAGWGWADGATRPEKAKRAIRRAASRRPPCIRSRTAGIAGYAAITSSWGRSS